MNKNRIISILLPIMLLASNVPAFGMLGQFARSFSKISKKSLAKKIAIGTGLLVGKKNISTLVCLRNNRSGSKSNPYYSKWNPWKWYLDTTHQGNMEWFGKKDASPENQKLFHKALRDVGVKNPERVPIKIMNNEMLRFADVNAITELTGIWLNPRIFESKFYPEKKYGYLRVLYNGLKKRLTNQEVLEECLDKTRYDKSKMYIAYHEASHKAIGHKEETCIDATISRKLPRYLYEPNTKKRRKRHEQEADELAGFYLT